jgi:hypothetical protein
MSHTTADLPDLSLMPQDEEIRRALADADARLSAWTAAMTAAQTALATAPRPEPPAEMPSAPPTVEPESATGFSPDGLTQTQDESPADGPDSLNLGSPSDDPAGHPTLSTGEGDQGGCPNGQLPDPQETAANPEDGDNKQPAESMAVEPGCPTPSSSRDDQGGSPDEPSPDQQGYSESASEIPQPQKPAKRRGRGAEHKATTPNRASKEEDEALLASLDPETAKAIRVMRRLSIEKKSVRELLEEYKATNAGHTPADNRKKSWWSRG